MILLILTSILIIYLFNHFYWKRRKLPPGPIPLPIIGNLYLMTEDVKPGYKMYEKLKDKYGPVFTFWLANLPMVTVTDWKLIKQHFIKDGANFVGRPEFPISMEMRQGPYGIIESHGDRWIQQRRFALHILRDFGLGKNLMEEKVLGEVTAMIDSIRKSMEDVDMQNIFDASVGSVINNMLFGYRYDETNIEEFLELKNRMNKHFKLAAEPMGGLIGMNPWLGHLPFFKGYKNVIMHNWMGLMEMFRKQATDRLASIDYDSDEYSDYVEAFLKERKKHENEQDFGGFEMEQLDSVCFDLWVAGMETTSNTLNWALLYVLLNPEVRQKVYEELEREIGSDRIITTTDRPKLNYINATVNESQRLANLLPMNLSRSTNADVEIAGYRIPKDTVITPQISSVMYDPEIFPEPYEFKPERFLESDGSLKKVEELVPFSIGKRQCLGEGLAKMELFLYFANLFNKFDIKFHESNPNPSIKKEVGVTMKAKNYRVSMKERY
ncbi:CYtochrome P450 family [Caenorhabditis elegans]|uniref:CYtochrome P450 family n=1 Tax=Caenorhabditis elegans TaxID=6239 RepID=Q27482_CAEEL|nr:CYtochrome P450 family [Caenorhabditis elegans]CCD67644.1 CYtochrome P450 family [Caenorhabditis elegans]|eukprot:NP_501480.2 CYtochrome P450 family [Caenorhabditis elegans]